MTSVGALSVSDFDFGPPLGSQGARIERVGRDHFRVSLGAAPGNPTWSNLLQFTLRRARGHSLRLDVSFEGATDYFFNTFFCSWSHDGIDWKPVQWREGFLKAKVRDVIVFPAFERDTVRVGHEVPFSYEDLTARLEECGRSPHARLVRLGDSPEGRTIWRLAVTEAGGPVPPERRRVHYFANQHPAEHNARWRIMGMIQWLLSDEARAFRQAAVCHFVPMMCPDGVAGGFLRVNSLGVDMNRSYRVAGADRQAQTPEAWIAQSDLEAIAAGGQLATVWSHHTCVGKVFPILLPGAAFAPGLGPWTDLRDAIHRYDPEEKLCAPLRTTGPDDACGGTDWTDGPNRQFGVSSFLIEGAGTICTKAENVQSGVVLMRGLADYCLKK